MMKKGPECVRFDFFSLFATSGILRALQNVEVIGISIQTFLRPPSPDSTTWAPPKSISGPRLRYGIHTFLNRVHYSSSLPRLRRPLPHPLRNTKNIWLRWALERRQSASRLALKDNPPLPRQLLGLYSPQRDGMRWILKLQGGRGHMVAEKHILGQRRQSC